MNLYQSKLDESDNSLMPRLFTHTGIAHLTFNFPLSTKNAPP